VTANRLKNATDVVQDYLDEATEAGKVPE